MPPLVPWRRLANLSATALAFRARRFISGKDRKSGAGAVDFGNEGTGRKGTAGIGRIPMTELDFEALFAASPNPYVLLDPAFDLVAMNDAYLRVTLRERADLIGRNMFAAFPSDPGSAEYRQLRGSLERVVETGLADHIPLIQYNIPLPDGRGFEERYWSASHTPILRADGAVAYILQHTVDVTELQRLRSLAHGALFYERGAAVESGVLRRAEAVQRLNERLEEEGRRLRALFVQAPGFVAIRSGPAHVFSMTNLA